ncbi:MAG: OsmC family protein [Candidatus Omnitrophica bacterium]|nr:OsmC family protein [Candidatus Omnitrophota bacterium]MDD5574464.1 OsmC family protein [Candidatus Omnitrophota bacterium]
MNTLTVTYKNGIQFEAATERHKVLVDLPVDKGGRDEGMSPPELFIASLGTCIGVYVVRYCQNAKIDAQECSISLDWRLSDDKRSIAAVEAKIHLPHAEPGPRARAVLEAARSCLIHNTLHGDLNIDVSLDASP